ncbi:MAG: hypothetical protein OHK005_11770 [Candidatus Methylacidiphilales bacterium]
MTKPDALHVSVINRQRKFALDWDRLSMETVFAIEGLGHHWPREITEVDVVLIAPRFSGQIHARYCGDSRPTDVITFPWGELLVCPAVAERQRRESGLSLHEEILTYICHGLLHLCGEDDATEAGYFRMAQRQDQLRAYASGRNPDQ